MVKLILLIGVSFYCIETALLFVAMKTKQFSYVLPTVHGVLFWTILGLKYFVFMPEEYVNLVPLPDGIVELMAKLKLQETNVESLFLMAICCAMVAGVLVRILAGYHIYSLWHVFAINGLYYFAKRMDSPYVKEYLTVGAIAFVAWAIMAICSRVVSSAMRNKYTKNNFQIRSDNIVRK